MTTSKQKNEILALLAAVKSGFQESDRSLSELAKLLRIVDETAGAESAESIATKLESASAELDTLIDSYQPLLVELRAQAARILRKSLDLNDVEIQ